MTWRERYAEIDAQLRELQSLVRDVGARNQGAVLLKPVIQIGARVVTEVMPLLDGAPTHVEKAFCEFERVLEKQMRDRPIPGSTDIAILMAASALRARLLAEMSSKEPEWVQRVELAFLHLQRQLEIDAGMARRWRNAFNSGSEPDLERLGGVHLLSHRLFGFKADGGGGRSDLVLGSHVNLGEVARTGAPLVLTEWKKVKGSSARAIAKDLDAKIESALHQLQRYQDGALAGEIPPSVSPNVPALAHSPSPSKPTADQSRNDKLTAKSRPMIMVNRTAKNALWLMMRAMTSRRLEVRRFSLMPLS